MRGNGNWNRHYDLWRERQPRNAIWEISTEQTQSDTKKCHKYPLEHRFAEIWADLIFKEIIHPFHTQSQTSNLLERHSKVIQTVFFCHLSVRTQHSLFHFERNVWCLSVSSAKDEWSNRMFTLNCDDGKRNWSMWTWNENKFECFPNQNMKINCLKLLKKSSKSRNVNEIFRLWNWSNWKYLTIFRRETKLDWFHRSYPIGIIELL
jgi:hypothetical protein